MAKKAASGGWLTDFERLAGGVFFVLYVVVFPLTLTWIFRGIEALLGTSFSAAREQEIYYYFVFVVTLLIFYNFIGKTTRRLFDDFFYAISTAAAGLVAFYGLNELLYRLSHTLLGGQTNLNDMAISAQTASVGRPTLLILIFIAPFVEEVLFRGYIFGMLRPRNRILAYAVSAVLFAFLHVWQFAAAGFSVQHLVLLVQYLVPGLVLCWTYDRCATIWCPVLTHVCVNALSILL